jgi:signal transduction histidine kinase
MVSLHDWLQIGGITAACGAAALLLGLLLLQALRTRGLALHLGVLAAAVLATVAASVVLTAHRMLISEHDSTVVLVVLLLATPVAACIGTLLGRSLRREARTLVATAAQLGSVRHLAADPPKTAELRTVAVALRDAAQRLDAARRHESALEQGRRELVAWMSHDLRTPLAGMRAMVEALQDGLAVDEQTVNRYHRQLATELQRMSDMVSDLFELSRIQGSLQLRLERLGAGELVEEALASADPVARAKGVHLVSGGDAGLPVQVDPTEFGRVLRNLLLNAIRHTPADGTIEVLAEPDGQTVSLTVSDRCGGIPEEDLPRVFETAFRGSSARTTAPDQRGGLGLAIARGIVEAHHGEITVANIGPGCRFRVRLPLASDVSAALPGRA